MMGVYVNDDPAGIDLAQMLDQISSERRAYALRHRSELDQKLSVAVYLLLKEALEKEFGIVENPRMGRGSTGKPYLVDHFGVHFNFSHCAKAAACVVSDVSVGIDVEVIAPVNDLVAERVLSADELVALRSSPEPEVVFARYWTQKEAVVKLLGGGIDENLLPNLLSSVPDVVIETTENRERGYVLTTARRERHEDDAEKEVKEGEKLFMEASGLPHREIPDLRTDGLYLDLLGESAEKGYAPAMAKLGEYAMRRGAWVEAYYWMSMARLHGMRGLSKVLLQIRKNWSMSGFPNQRSNIHRLFPVEAGSIGRALLRVDSGREAASAREFLRTHYPQFLR